VRDHERIICRYFDGEIFDIFFTKDEKLPGEAKVIGMQLATTIFLLFRSLIGHITITLKK